MTQISRWDMWSCVMSKPQRISLTIRVISGVIGLPGFVAIAFNATQDGGIKMDFMLFSSFFAGSILLFVAFFGKYPWDRRSAVDAES
jgi:hypothetical protein